MYFYNFYGIFRKYFLSLIAIFFWYSHKCFTILDPPKVNLNFVKFKFFDLRYFIDFFRLLVTIKKNPLLLTELAGTLEKKKANRKMTSLTVGLNLGMRQIDYIYKNFDPISFSKNVKNYKKYRSREDKYFLTNIVLNSVRDIDYNKKKSTKTLSLSLDLKFI